ncbi:MAG: DUF1638 domain-containing protein [Alphaproteobacteria bacterium]|nr:DUF1638 domain-containing protein [Alphaproteobacteria bacterium]
MAARIDDAALTERGLDAPGDPIGGRVLLLACGALAREVLAVIKINRLSHMDLTCLPANLHLYPEKITERVREAVLEHRDHYRQIFVLYADCGTGGMLQKECEALGVKMLAGPHCYSFFEGNETFAAHDDEITAFYLTDFLVRQFEAFFWKPMGLDRHPELLPMYFGNYEKLVYQAQTDDNTLKELAKTYADRLGLAYEYRFTGYGDLAKSLRDFS